ncbi:hypothetical protein D3C85_1777930 [compost metagenome]
MQNCAIEGHKQHHSSYHKKGYEHDFFDHWIILFNQLMCNPFRNPTYNKDIQNKCNYKCRYVADDHIFN